MSKESFAQWVEGCESYYVTDDEYHKAQDEHGVDVMLPLGITVVWDSDIEQKKIPARDIQHGEWTEVEK